MSKRAEEAALKAYPVQGMWVGNQYGDWDEDINHVYRNAFLQGYEQAEKELTPLINRLCEAILFEWKDVVDLARKTLIQIKERKE